MSETRKTPGLPQLEELRGASPMTIQRALECLKEFCQSGRRPPDGYLFALSREVSAQLQG
ncbi:hypothetical protein [Caldimonas tepidiphila]|uniref:hypothetical protein n=1 Tax=Caldimonas tepidiphila TaxID=2315841 RepID=UPI000E5BCC5E|nr:hypothetical protein [Caldimonas tepidiphila]